MKRLLTLFLVLAAAASAQTVNHGAANGTGSASLVWTAPQAAGDTLILTVSPPGGVLSDAAGDVFPLTENSDCAMGAFAIYRAPAQASTANVITYTLAGQKVFLWATEQTGLFNLDVCGAGSASTTSNGPAVPVAAQSASVPQPGDLAYAFLVDAPGNSGIQAATGFSVLDGRAAPFYGPSAYTGVYLDAIGAGAGPSFLLEPGTGANTAQVLEAWYAAASVPQPVTLTFGPSVSPLMPCTGVVSYDDGSPLFSSPQTFVILEQEGSAQVSIGTPTINTNGQVTGSVTVNPNYAANGQVLLFATIGGIAGLPQIQAQPFDPRQLQQGSTGICIGVVLFKSITLPKYSVLGLTP